MGITKEESIRANSGNTKPNALNLLRKSDCASFLRSGVPSAARIVLTEAIGAYSILLTVREKAVGLLPLFVKRRLFS
jgi:hypothetical protein